MIIGLNFLSWTSVYRNKRFFLFYSRSNGNKLYFVYFCVFLSVKLVNSIIKMGKWKYRVRENSIIMQHVNFFGRFRIWRKLRFFMRTCKKKKIKTKFTINRRTWTKQNKNNNIITTEPYLVPRVARSSRAKHKDKTLRENEHYYNIIHNYLVNISWIIREFI